jgi:hypothetical protein
MGRSHARNVAHDVRRHCGLGLIRARETNPAELIDEMGVNDVKLQNFDARPAVTTLPVSAPPDGPMLGSSPATHHDAQFSAAPSLAYCFIGI